MIKRVLTTDGCGGIFEVSGSNLLEELAQYDKGFELFELEEGDILLTAEDTKALAKELGGVYFSHRTAHIIKRIYRAGCK